MQQGVWKMTKLKISSTQSQKGWEGKKKRKWILQPSEISFQKENNFLASYAENSAARGFQGLEININFHKNFNSLKKLSLGDLVQILHKVFSSE